MIKFKNILIVIGLTGLLLFSCQLENDNLNTDIPNRLVGVTLQYTYSEGNAYTLRIDDDSISYQFRSGSRPEKWWGKFKYNYLITDNNEHLISWFEPGYGDYVTLLINFDKHILYGSGILAGKTIHFQKANITKIKLP